MAVEERLKAYWNSAKLWHRTGDPVWLGLLELMAMDTFEPGGGAAALLVRRLDKELAVDSS